jgi:hypothetical protein
MVTVAAGEGDQMHQRASDKLPFRFWLATGLAVLNAAFSALTLAWRDWIEILFGVDPDHHSGSLEWAVVTVSLTVAVALAAAAGVGWRRVRARALSAG